MCLEASCCLCQTSYFAEGFFEKIVFPREDESSTRGEDSPVPGTPRSLAGLARKVRGQESGGVPGQEAHRGPKWVFPKV